MKHYLQTIEGISHAAYSGKQKRFFYTIAGQSRSILYKDLQKIIQDVPKQYHFKLLS